MKPSLLLLSAAMAACLPALAAEPPPGTPRPAGPFRVFKPDGSTLLQQGQLMGSGALATLTVDASNAIAAGNGRCAFTVKYDEVATAAASKTTNRLYSNDQLVAQNSQIDLAAGVVKTIWTQPYLFAGANNVKVLINADSTTPVTGWIRVNVTGSCGGAAAPAPAPALPPAPPAPPTPPATGDARPGSGDAKPPAPPAPTSTSSGSSGKPVASVSVKVGMPDWGNLLVAYGYSNFAVNGLKTRGYARYAELVKLNADLTAAIASRAVELGAFNALIARWNSFVNDADFRRLMKDIKPGDPK
jgi:hypothetical protein